MSEKKEKSCNSQTEVYSRVVGYFRPVQNWNTGKKEEFKERKAYLIGDDLGPKPCGC